MPNVKIIVALVLVLSLLGVGLAGYERGYSKGFDLAAAQGVAALSGLKSDQARAMNQALDQAAQRYAIQAQHLNQLAQDALDLRGRLATQQQHDKDQVDAVIYHPAPGAGQCVFTRGFVRVWNHAAGTDNGGRAVPDASAPAGADAAAAADDAVDSGVSQGDVLDWFIDYAARARANATQLNLLLDSQAPQPETH
ncbi:hypothetical protein ACPRNU_12600 [Chromobacterium vaccinii]|uniref:hypothetical protein n=1 Tax=Chromobacterium vaccinii TaxID=1108595 RepID=UPI003C74AA3A